MSTKCAGILERWRVAALLVIAVVGAVLLSGCAGGTSTPNGTTPTDPPVDLLVPQAQDGQPVTVSAASLGVSGGEIIYGGESHSGSVEVAADDLVGIIKGDDVYLYHPALGDMELSEETSRRAVAAFMLFLGTEGEDAAAAEAISRGVDGSDRRGAYRWADMPSDIISGDGYARVRVERSGGKVRFINKANRWVALLIRREGGVEERYLPPSGRTLDNNMMRMVQKHSGRLWNASVPTELDSLFAQTSNFDFDDSDIVEVEVFGAYFRGAVGMAVEWSLPEGASKAYEEHPWLVVRLNAIDLSYALYEGLKSLASVLPLELADAAVGGALSWVQAEILGAITQDERVETEYYRMLQQDMADVGKTYVPNPLSWAAFEVIAELWDIVCVGGYVCQEWLLPDSAMVRGHAYERIKFDQVVDVPAAPLRQELQASIAKHAPDHYNPSQITHRGLMAVPWISPDIKTSGVSSLQGLQYSSLANLSISGNPITSLAPLEGIPALDALFMSECQVTDLSPIAGRTDLIRLDAGDNWITDLSPLSGLPKLSVLTLRRTYASDLSPINSLPKLEHLTLSACARTSLGSLSNNHIKSLDVSLNELGSLSFVSRFPHLTSLKANDNNFTSATPLATRTSLDEVDLSGNSISDITPFASLGELSELNLEHNSIKSIEPMRQHPGTGGAVLDIYLKANPIDWSEGSAACKTEALLSDELIFFYYE